MSTFRIAAAAAALVLGVLVWKQHAKNVEAAAIREITDEQGFIALIQPSGADPKKVWIVAAVNCPKEGAQRADQLARDLAEREMAFDRRSNVSFAPEDQQMADRITAVMNGDTPIVFVNGRMKANPELEEIIAEYKAAQL
jgi:hypothetical protein